MKRYVSRIAILALLVCGACHSSDQYLDQDCQDKSRLAVSAVMEGSEEATGSSDYYKHDRFILNRSIIRVVNTVNTVSPILKMESIMIISILWKILTGMITNLILCP